MAVDAFAVSWDDPLGDFKPSSPTTPAPPYSLCNPFSPKLGHRRALQWNLESAVLQVEAQYEQVDSPAKRIALDQAVQACHKTVDDFLSSNTKDFRALNPHDPEHSERNALFELPWKSLSRGELTIFYGRISAHVQSLQTLLITIQVSSMETARWSNDGRQDGIGTLNHTDSANHSIVLINSSFDTLRKALIHQGSISQQTLANVDAVRQIMILNNIQLLSAIKQLQDSLPPQVLLRTPILFTDALNRLAPIHLEWINSWDAFFAVLAIRFKDRGHGKVKRKEFVIQNRVSQRIIDFVRPLELCVSPGQKLDMSMVFREIPGIVSMNDCPRCHEPSSGDAEDEVECWNCKCRFRRIEVLDEPCESNRELSIGIFQSTSTAMNDANAAASRKRRGSEAAEPEEDVQPSHFERLQMVRPRLTEKNAPVDDFFTRHDSKRRKVSISPLEKNPNALHIPDTNSRTEASPQNSRGKILDQASWKPQVTTQQMDSLFNLDDQQRSPVEFSHAISYVNKIQKRFAQQPDIYKEFLEILQTYQRESKPIGDVCTEVTRLLRDTPDLLEDFKLLLPNNTAQKRASDEPGLMPESSSNLESFPRSTSLDSDSLGHHSQQSSGQDSPQIGVGSPLGKDRSGRETLIHYARTSQDGIYALRDYQSQSKMLERQRAQWRPDSNGLHTTGALAQQNLSRSSQEYDKYALSKIGKASSTLRQLGSESEDRSSVLTQRRPTMNLPQGSSSAIPDEPIGQAEQATSQIDSYSPFGDVAYPEVFEGAEDHASTYMNAQPNTSINYGLGAFSLYDQSISHENVVSDGNDLIDTGSPLIQDSSQHPRERQSSNVFNWYAPTPAQDSRVQVRQHYPFMSQQSAHDQSYKGDIQRSRSPIHYMYGQAPEFNTTIFSNTPDTSYQTRMHNGPVSLDYPILSFSYPIMFPSHDPFDYPDHIMNTLEGTRNR